jgi:hypothetical protein
LISPPSRAGPQKWSRAAAFVGQDRVQ